MSEEIQFKCQECGKEFDPDPEAMVETHLQGECPCCESGATKEQIDEMLASGAAFTGEQLEAMSEYELSEHGLTVEDREKLLAGEDISGGMCICRECQDRLQAEQP